MPGPKPESMEDGVFPEKEDKEGEVRGENPLERAIDEVGETVDAQKIEEEAYKEKRRREAFERAKKEAEDRRERTWKRAFNEGTATYLAMKVGSELSRLSREHQLTHERKKELVEEAWGELEEQDYDRRFDFEEYVDSTLFGKQGEFLHFGPYTMDIEGSFNKEEYFATTGELKELLEKKWEKKAEEAEENEIMALQRETDWQAFQRHLEGFGKRALEEDDLVSAVDAFVIGDKLGDEEIAGQIAEKMREMMESRDESKRAQALEAKDKIKEVLVEGEE